jgi:hypothetical protein
MCRFVPLKWGFPAAICALSFSERTQTLNLTLAGSKIRFNRFHGLSDIRNRLESPRCGNSSVRRQTRDFDLANRVFETSFKCSNRRMQCRNSSRTFDPRDRVLEIGVKSSSPRVVCSKSGSTIHFHRVVCSNDGAHAYGPFPALVQRFGIYGDVRRRVMAPLQGAVSAREE